MGKLVVHTDEVRDYLKDMHEHYSEQEESIENHMKLLDEAMTLLAPADLTAVNYELEALKDKGNEFVGDRMPDVHDVLATTKPVNPYIEAISTINQFMSKNDLPTFNQTIRQIQPFNRTTETVDGISMEDVIQGAGEISGAYDLYRAFGMSDPVTGEKLGYDEWLVAVGWTILMITPARLLKGAGKVGSAAKGTMSTRAAKALQSQEKLSSLTDLSKVSLQAVNNQAKQMNKKQIERVEEMLDRYAYLLGPRQVPAMAGSGSFDGLYMYSSGRTGNLVSKNMDYVPSLDKVEVKFNRNPKHDPDEFARQLKNQEEGMNQLTVEDYLQNRERYLAEGRAIEGNAVQQAAREKELNKKIEELFEEGMSWEEAEKQAKQWIKSKAALHNPDQIAGGNPLNIGGIGDKGVNSSIGSQWKYRIDIVDERILDLTKNLTPEQMKNTYLDVSLIH